jgi:NitT/TauT family transport system ATP-binding protein
VAVIAPAAAPAAIDRAAAIQAVGLRHTYRAREGAVEALAPTDLIVGSGELLAVLGPSGCGKSTLLRILAGLIEPSAGQVRLAGRPPIEVRRHHGIGWLAQDDGLLPWRSVADNVALPLRIGRRGPIDAERIAAILELVGLAEAARRYPHELSGGMRQRAALARALVARPAFLFLDEPFASLDELTRERLGELLLAVRAASRPTTLLVTHSVAEAVRLADRVVVLSPRPGRVLADVPVALDQPRRDNQPGFGEMVQELKHVLVRG